MRAGTRTFILIAIVGALLAMPGHARADEADNFTCRARLSRDSIAELDGWVNARIQEAIDRANRRGVAACGASCLSRELQHAVGGNYLHPATFIPHSRFSKWIKGHQDIERCHVPFRETIYGARAYDRPWLFPFTGRIIFVADSIRLSGRVVGIDKIDHFIREGLAHWRAIDRHGGDIASSLAREVGTPGSGFRWTEYGLKGMALTGVFAYADLAAGYFGYRFWDDLLSFERAGSFVAYDATTGRFAQRRRFTFATYVNGAWDESVNCSAFHPELAREVAGALARRSLTCPAGADLTLAEMPDADLYVNPIHLAELRTSKFELRSFSHTLGSDAARNRARTGYLWRRHRRP